MTVGLQVFDEQAFSTFHGHGDAIAVPCECTDQLLQPLHVVGETKLHLLASFAVDDAELVLVPAPVDAGEDTVLQHLVHETSDRDRAISVADPPDAHPGARGTTPALAEFFGTEAGLSAAVITRLTKSWEAEQKAFCKRDLSKVDYVYVWADGVHVKVRLGEDRKLCLLVIVGVRADGTKELVACADGHRESTTSWAEVLRGLKRRGMRAPVLAVGDGALGFWGAIDEVFPETRHQRDWVHMAANVLDALPKSVQPAAKRALAEITNAEDRDHAERAVDLFAAEFGAKWPKAVDKILSNREALLAFYDFPAEHWGHLRTSNPIESTFSTVRARTNVTKGPGSREAGLAMAFKLLQAAEGRWRRVNAPELVALVRAGAKFVGGKLVERSEDEDAA